VSKIYLVCETRPNSINNEYTVVEAYRDPLRAESRARELSDQTHEVEWPWARRQKLLKIKFKHVVQEVDVLDEP
jgi:hypothetical protein